MPKPANSRKISIIGAGVIGVSIAIRLQELGFNTVIFDRHDPSMKASEGNAGGFAFSEIFPLASPKVVRNAPKWLLDRNGPLSIPPQYVLQISPWLYKFWRMTSPRKFEEGTQGQLALMKLSQRSLKPFLKMTKTENLLKETGVLQIYSHSSNFAQAKKQWEIAQKNGYECRHMEGVEALRNIQPGLSDKVVAGTFTPHWWRIHDPKIYLQKLTEFYQKIGGEIRNQEVRAIRPTSEGTRLELINGEEFECEKAVVAAGAWSHLLAKTLGEKIPLETERGYNTTFWKSDFKLNCHLALGEHGFVIAPIGEGVRVGGAVELGGLKTPPNFRRADVMLKLAKSFLPELPMDDGEQWMGYRPTLPDSLPAIGHSKACQNVIYAFGHGHLGLTQSAGTAEIVADLILKRDPKIDLAPYRFDRFQSL